MADSKSSSKPVLTYFMGRGYGETTRLMFAEAKMDYEDKRVASGSADWTSLKPTCPFGQIPILKTTTGLTIAQSGAIERYVAKITKLYGANDLEAAQIDMVVEGIRDLLKNLLSSLYLKDEAEKKTKIEAYFKDEFPRWADQLNAILKANTASKGEWFVGNSISYADIAFYNHGSVLIPNLNAKALDAFPELKALVERVGKRAGIEAWVKVRPASAF